MHFPERQGLYDPRNEKDSCGIGFLANIKGQRSHQILVDASEMLINLSHRGVCGAEANTGDGAGFLTALPYEFLAKAAQKDLGLSLPPAGKFGAGVVFLPTIDKERDRCKAVIRDIVSEQGQQLLGWRTVPTDAKGVDIGPAAQASQPAIEQLFIASGDDLEGEAFERQLYIIRKRASHLLRGSEMEQAKMFYICSLSTRVLVYKGQLMPKQLVPFYPDLANSDYTSHLAMMHSRFSTNTFPSWDRAHPNRYMCHNGEINTLQGNTNWMRAREGVVKSDLFGDELSKVFPIIEPDCSDSGNFDNALEFFIMTGRSLPEAVMMMIPEAWENHESMSQDKRDFYEYHSCLMEPWDGPASIAFTDGHYIGAVLDRNGLRPSRYYVTFDDRVIMASEVGVLAVDPAIVKLKGRLQPGKIFLVNFEEGRIVADGELKNDLASRRPYGKWIGKQRIQLEDLKPKSKPPGLDQPTLLPRLQAFGYNLETFQFMLFPLVREKRDPVGSMGNDSALSCLSDQPHLLYDYFKQLFAQVTNPAIDSIREEVIMSLKCYIGPEGNLLETTEAQAHRLRVNHPILSNQELAAIKDMDFGGWKTQTLDLTWPKSEGEEGMVAALDRICAQAEKAIDDGFSLLVLSDRAVGNDRVPLSSLMACGAVHNHLVRSAKRTRIGIVLESGEAREVHHHCLLIGYGADAINPYLVFEALRQVCRDGLLEDEYTDETIIAAYRKGVAKGMLKVMAKMGISTLQSYKGSPDFRSGGPWSRHHRPVLYRNGQPGPGR